MPGVDLTDLTIAEAAAQIRARELSPVELTEAYVQRIERLNPRLNAYVTVTADRAREDARRAESEIAAEHYRGPLHGIPIALKDLYATAGIRTTGGAKILDDWVPDADSTAARRLHEAGSVLLGKLNTHELAMGVTTTNPHYGATRNPWNLDCIPGGSSGGSGAATAARLALGTLGTDTGGSIRIPASLCGVVGLKPTYGRVSKAGVLPLSWLFDHAGPIARTVDDAAYLLQAIAGYDAADAASVRTPVPDYLTEIGAGVRGLRLGVPRAYFFDRLDDEVRAAVEAAIGVFEQLGASVRDVEIRGIESISGALRVGQAEARHTHARALETRPQDFGADVAAILAQPPIGGIEFAAALQFVNTLTEAMRQQLEAVDLLLTPATSLPAPRIGETMVAYGGVEETVLAALIRCTVPFNATRLPAISLPCGFSAAGLPLGLQIAGRPFDEALVLRAARAYEQATEWHRRVPPE